MRPLLLALLLLLDGSPRLSEIDQLKAENHQLKVQLLQTQEQLAALQIKLQTLALEQERGTLEDHFRQTLQPTADAVFDWTTFSFHAPGP
jgi:hypothetical protein